MCSYDIEDAIVMNKCSLDRGFGRCIVIKKYAASLKKYANRTMDRIVAPVLGQGAYGLACKACAHACTTTSLHMRVRTRGLCFAKEVRAHP